MLTAEFSKGVGGRFPDNPYLGGIPLSRPDASPLFSKLSAFARIFQSLPEDFQLALFLRGQTSFGQSLPQGDQMSLDATDIAVSGFAAGTINADRGYTVRSEFSRPMPELNLNFASANPTPYVFAATGRGAVEHTYADEFKYTGVQSIGGGLRVGFNVPGLPVASSLGVEVAKDYSTNYIEYPGGYRTNFAYVANF